MTGRIDYFFSPISGFAYLGHDALYRLAAEHGASVVPRPIDTLALFAAIGITPPPKQNPARLRYRQTDMRRWAACRRLPLVVEPRHWPTDATLGSLCVIAAAALGVDAGRLASALLAAVWTRDLDIADRQTVAAIAAECGLDAEAILDRAGDAQVAERYAANTAEAIERGAPGSPTFVLGDQIFFGQDRLAFLGHALRDAPAA